MTKPSLTAPDIAEIIEIRQDTSDTKTFTLQYIDSEKQKAFNFVPGKFMMVSVFGVGEMPISISSSPLKTDSLQLTIVDVGNLTHAMHRLKEGDKVGLRGPFGNGFPIQKFRKKNLVFISGGCGMAPLKPVVDAVIGKKEEFGKLTLLYGCKAPENMLFNKELEDWDKAPELTTLKTVDNPTPEWEGESGVVTKLFSKAMLNPENAIALIVGPPVMIHFAIIELKKMGFKEAQIYASLERLMYCGMGKCAHCNCGGKYACIDGPVFNGEELAKMPLGEK